MSARRPGPRRCATERGSIAVELAFVAPLLLLLLALVAAYGRVAQVNGVMEAGARDGARAASQARTVEQARSSARDAVVSALGPGAGRCLASLQVELVGPFRAGLPVRVRAQCSYALGDLGLPGVPGEVTVRSTFSSPVDPNRGIEPGPGS